MLLITRATNQYKSTVTQLSMTFFQKNILAFFIKIVHDDQSKSL